MAENNVNSSSSQETDPKNLANNNVLKPLIDAHIDFPFCLGFDPSVQTLNKLQMVDLSSKEKVLENLRAFNASLLSVAVKKKMIIKPQSAFYEQWGLVGNIALQELIINANVAGTAIILDVKRSDIGKTMQAYVNAYSKSIIMPSRQPNEYPDAYTVNPFIGSDSIESCLMAGGAVILLRTSNAGAESVQEAQIDGHSISENFLDILYKHNQHNQYKGFGNTAAVVGATKHNFVKHHRDKLKNTLLLVPGFGAQGGDEAFIKDFFIGGNARPKGAIINIGSSVVAQEADSWSSYETKVSESLGEQTTQLLDKINSAG